MQSKFQPLDVTVCPLKISQYLSAVLKLAAGGSDVHHPEDEVTSSWTDFWHRDDVSPLVRNSGQWPSPSGRLTKGQFETQSSGGINKEQSVFTSPADDVPGELAH